MPTQESRLTKDELARLRLYARKFRAWWHDAGSRLVQQKHLTTKPAPDKKRAA